MLGKSDVTSLTEASAADSLLCTKQNVNKRLKGKVFLYSLPSVGPGADPGVQTVSPQVT